MESNSHYRLCDVATIWMLHPPDLQLFPLHPGSQSVGHTPVTASHTVPSVHRPHVRPQFSPWLPGIQAGEKTVSMTNA